MDSAISLTMEIRISLSFFAFSVSVDFTSIYFILSLFQFQRVLTSQENLVSAGRMLPGFPARVNVRLHLLHGTFRWEELPQYPHQFQRRRNYLWCPISAWWDAKHV